MYLPQQKSSSFVEHEDRVEQLLNIMGKYVQLESINAAKTFPYLYFYK